MSLLFPFPAALTNIIRVSEKQLLATSYLPACLPVRLSVCPLHRTTWPQIIGFSLHMIFEYLLRSVQDICVSLKSKNNFGYFTLSPAHSYEHISLNSYNDNCFWHNAQRKSKYTILFNTFFFFGKSCRL
jgi:hypothetical protein